MATRDDHQREDQKQMSRRDFLKLAGIAGATIGLGSGVAAWVTACGGTQQTTTTTAGAASSTTVSSMAPGSSSTAASTASTAAAGGKTVKIGYLAWLTGIQGVQFYNSVKANNAMVNNNGGVKVGTDQYKVDLIAYDNNNDQNTGVAGANKLIFQDKAPFVIADDFVDAFYKDSEANKVLVSAKSLMSNLLVPTTKYLFNTGFSNAETIVGMRWWIDKYPDKKSIMLILPDMELGHVVSDLNAAVCKMYGMTVSQEFYTLGNPDLSPVGTKVKQANPDVVCLFEMTPLKAIRESGWTGQFFSVATNSIETMLATASAADIEGFLGTAYPTEFDPPLTQAAKDFKDAYTNLTGKWDNPAPSDTAMYSAVIAAIEQAGSVDVDKVADVMANGMAWESPCGPLKMVARPDVGNKRTVDSVNTVYMKQIVGGKVTLLDTIAVDVAEQRVEDFLVKSAANAPQGGAPSSTPPSS